MAKVFLTIANGGFSYYNLVNNSTHFWILLAPKITHQLLKIHKTVIKRKEKKTIVDYASFIFHTVGIQIVILGWFPFSITVITCNLVINYMWCWRALIVKIANTINMVFHVVVVVVISYLTKRSCFDLC